VNEAAADLACHRTQKLEDKCIIKNSEDEGWSIEEEGAEETKNGGKPMSLISEGGQSEGDPESPVSDMCEGEGSRSASRAPSEDLRPRSREESITDDIRQEIANSIDDENLPRSAAPETPVEKSNMDKFDEYLK